MENEKKIMQTALTKDGAFIPWKDVEEYRAYKRRKRLNEIATAFSGSKYSLCENGELQRVCEKAIRLGQPSVRVPLTKLAQTRLCLGASKVVVDCFVGGTGETLTAVKIFEARKAVRAKAGEITLAVTPSLVGAMRYGDIKRELRRIKRVAGKAKFTVFVRSTHTPSALTRLARLASEVGADYFSVPYHTGCERLRLDLTGGCKLEITGVDDLPLWRKLRSAGVSRIVTGRAWEMHAEWLQEEEEPQSVSVSAKENLKESEKSANATSPTASALPAVPEGQKYDPERDYQCKLVGDKLQFS